jgi:hypothetical protein
VYDPTAPRVIAAGERFYAARLVTAAVSEQSEIEPVGVASQFAGLWQTEFARHNERTLVAKTERAAGLARRRVGLQRN